jgi:hypothetical protein
MSQQNQDPNSARLNRRRFVQLAGTATVLAGTGMSRLASAAPSPKSQAETIVNELYSTLSDSQKEMICFGFDDPKRSRANANWHITKPVIDDKFYTKAQQDLMHRVIKSVTSEDGYERLEAQTADDDGGFGAYSVAMFGSPEDRGLQFVLTGRHLTLRADGNTVKNMAFGGPIIYGHGEGDPNENIFHYQTQQANEVFAALDTDQRAKALLAKPPGEANVPLQGANGKFTGIAGADLKADQLELLEATLKVILGPYRDEDKDEVLEIVKASGGLEKLNMAFYKEGDLGGDQKWDNWRIEGPSLVCHFRGAPHVHAYIHVGMKS